MSYGVIVAELYVGASGPNCWPVSLEVMGVPEQTVETMLGWTGLSGRFRKESLSVIVGRSAHCC